MVDTFIAQLGFIRSNWHSPGRPTITVLLTESLIGRGLRRAGGVQPGRKSILALFAEAKSGRVGDVRVKVGRMQEMIGTACIDSLDFMTRRVGTSEDWKRILSGKASFDANVPREKLQVSTLMSTMRMRKRSGALSQTCERLLGLLSLTKPLTSFFLPASTSENQASQDSAVVFFRCTVTR